MSVLQPFVCLDNSELGFKNFMNVKYDNLMLKRPKKNTSLFIFLLHTRPFFHANWHCPMLRTENSFMQIVHCCDKVPYLLAFCPLLLPNSRPMFMFFSPSTAPPKKAHTFSTFLLFYNLEHYTSNSGKTGSMGKFGKRFSINLTWSLKQFSGSSKAFYSLI